MKIGETYYRYNVIYSTYLQTKYEKFARYKSLEQTEYME